LFSGQEIEYKLQLNTGIDYKVERTTSTSFSVRPSGIQSSTPGFSVIVERRNFRLHANVVLDSFGGQLASAIRSGVANNPIAVSSAIEALQTIDWKSDILISDDLITIGASDNQEFLRDPGQLVERAVQVVAVLGELVLENYIFTKPLEFRRAILHKPSPGTGEHQVWEYDPSERDKSTATHRMLENWLIEQLSEKGIEPLVAIKGPQFDVGWRANDSLVVCEVKSTNHNEIKQIRLGLGQVLHYRYEVQKYSDRDVIAALMIQSQPVDSMMIGLCKEVGVRIFWPDEAGIPTSLLEGSTPK